MISKNFLCIAFVLLPLAALAGAENECDVLSGDAKEMCQAKRSGDGKFCTKLSSELKKRDCLAVVRDNQHQHLLTYKPMTEHKGNKRYTKPELKPVEPVVEPKKGH